LILVFNFSRVILQIKWSYLTFKFVKRISNHQNLHVLKYLFIRCYCIYGANGVILIAFLNDFTLNFYWTELEYFRDDDFLAKGILLINNPNHIPIINFCFYISFKILIEFIPNTLAFDFWIILLVFIDMGNSFKYSGDTYAAHAPVLFLHILNLLKMLHQLIFSLINLVFGLK